MCVSVCVCVCVCVWSLYLPDHDVPGGLLQQGPVCSDGGEHGLSSALPHGWPRVHAQLPQPGVQTQPQAVKGRGRVEGPVQGLSPLLGLLLQRGLLPLQLLGDGLAPLEEVVRDVPLWGNRWGVNTVGQSSLTTVCFGVTLSRVRLSLRLDGGVDRDWMV